MLRVLLIFVYVYTRCDCNQYWYDWYVIQYWYVYVCVCVCIYIYISWRRADVLTFLQQLSFTVSSVYYIIITTGLALSHE